MTREDIRSIVKANLKKLCTAKNLTQTELGEILDVSGKSTISNYLNEKEPSVPDIASLYLLKERFGIPLDTLLSPSFDPETSFEIDGVDTSQYDKFLGVYSLYYISSSKLSQTPYESNKPLLSYGVLAIVKDNGGADSLSNLAYRTYACFSLKDAEQAEEVKKAVQEALSKNDLTAVRNVFATRKRFSEGNFELIFQGKFYSMSLTGFSNQKNTRRKNEEYRTISDKISILGFNPPNTDVDEGSYIGGGVLTASISRGLNKCPCSQIVLISRKSIFEDLQDVTRYLRKHHQRFNADQVAANIIERQHQLQNKGYTEEDNDTLLSSFIKTSIVQELDSKVSQLLSIFENEDQFFYEFLKNCQ